MSEDNFDKLLTQEEAEVLHELLAKLNTEMNQRIQEGGFDTGEVSYTTITRNKQRRYLEEIYDVE